MAVEERPDFKLLNKTRQRALIRLAETSADGSDAVDWSADPSGRLRTLTGQFGERTKDDPMAVARDFLASHADLFGLDEDLSGLGEPSVVEAEDEERAAIVRFPQIVQDTRVYASGFRVEVTSVGMVTSVCGRTVDVEKVPDDKGLDAESAIALAREQLGAQGKLELTAERVLTDVPFGSFEDEPTINGAWLTSVEGPEAKVDVLVQASGAITTVVTPVGETDADDCPTEIPRYHLNPATGVPDFVTFGPAGCRTSRSASGDPARAALAFFSDHPLMFATGDVPNQLRVTRIDKDPGPPNLTHVVLQQIYGGVEVLGAELRIHLDQALNVTSINGNYLRDPRVVPVAGLAQFEARDTAVQAVQRFRNRNNIAGDPAKDVQDEGLVLFPGELTQAPYARNAMAWQFRFPEMTMLVDARSSEFQGGVLFAYPHQLGADRVILDALGLGEISFPVEVMRNSNPVGATPPNAEVAPADAFMSSVLAFYQGQGRASWDGRDSPGEFVTNAAFTLTPANPAHWDIVRQQAWFETGMIGAWLAGHEFTHGVTMSTAFLMPIDEPGALNEHYSDVLGSCVVRNFNSISTTPSTYAAYLERLPGCAAPEDVFTGMCDSGNVHTNAAIGNRAAVLLGEGNPPSGSHAGIGFNRLARLFFDTLTMRLHPWSTYIDERLNTWETARALAARGALVVDDNDPTKTIGFGGVAAEVSWAYSAAGIDPSLIPGWFTVPGSPTGQHSGDRQTWYLKESMPNCELVGDVELVVQALDPIHGQLPYWEGRSRVNGPGGGSVSFPGGVFGASIVAHGAGTANKETTVDYFHSGFLPFQFHPVIQPIRDPSCPPTTTTTPMSEFVTDGVSHWHDFFGGGKGMDRLNLGQMVLDPASAPCNIDRVELELLDKNGQIIGRTQLGSPPAVFRYGPNGLLSFGVELVNAMINTADPGIDVNWWFDIGSAVRYRVHYYCTGDRCDLRT